MPTKKSLIILPLLLLLSLTACMSLAEDITPPPGMAGAQPPQNNLESRPTSTPLGPVSPQAPPDPNNGAPIYAEKCTPCHGETGLGDGPDTALLENQPAALGTVDLARSSTPFDWFRMVTQGDMKKFMPPFSSLNDQERWDVVAYLYTLSASPQIVDQGQALFVQNCAECHGDDGRQGDGDLTNQAMMSARSAEELFATITTGKGEMAGFDQLSEDDRWALTAYLRSLTFLPEDEAAVAETSPGEDQTPDTGAPSETEAEVPQTVETGDGSGSLTVHVTNTAGGDLPAVDITLRGYDEMVEVYTQTLTLSAGSGVTFEDVPITLDRMYFASIEHANAVYGSEVLVVEPGSPEEMNLDISYYPPTTDVSVLNVDRLHVFFSFVNEDTLEIFQLYIFSNPTDKVLTPVEGAETAVNFTLPPNATDLSVEDNMSMAYRKTGDGFGIVNVYPDENAYQAVFSYQVPYPQRKLGLSLPIGMDANAVIVMAPSNGFKVKSDQLIDAGLRDIEGVSYMMYTGSKVRTGSTLEISLSGIPKESTEFFTSGDESNNSLVIGLAGLGLALIVAGIFLWRRNQGVDGEWLDDDIEDDEQVGAETNEDLMDAIIALDDKYRTGNLPENAYRQRRLELKEKLQEMMENQNGE